jgi:hypothetical protein
MKRITLVEKTRGTVRAVGELLFEDDPADGGGGFGAPISLPLDRFDQLRVALELAARTPGSPLFVEDCDCPWNNGYVIPARMGHRRFCRSLKREHSPDDACSQVVGHRDDTVDGPAASADV